MAEIIDLLRCYKLASGYSLERQDPGYDPGECLSLKALFVFKDNTGTPVADIVVSEIGSNELCELSFGDDPVERSCEKIIQDLLQEGIIEPAAHHGPDFPDRAA